MITLTSKGELKDTRNFLERCFNFNYDKILVPYGEAGVRALASATPKDSGETASAWSYEIVKGNGEYSIIWKNSKLVNGIPLVLLLRYGHGTGTGGYVQGQNFITPAIEGIFKQIADEAWREVTKG